MSILKLNSEFRINNRSTGSQYGAAITTDADGNFRVVWEEALNERNRIYTRRFQKDGRPLSDDLLVQDLAFSPAIAMDRDGNVAIAHTLPNERTNSRDIYVSRLTSTDRNQNGFFAVEREDFQGSAAIAISDDGSYMVTWTSLNQDGDGAGIYARQFNADGSPAGAEVRVNATTRGNQFEPAIATNGKGNFVITWSSFGQDGSGYGIYAQLFNVNGRPVGGELPVNLTTENDQLSAKVVMGADGSFVVAWGCRNKGLVARRFDAVGQPLSDEIQISQTSTGSHFAPSIALDSQGNFVVAWASTQERNDADIYMRRFSATGSPLSDELRVNSHTPGRQVAPTVAMQGDGNFIVTWQSQGQDGDGYGIYAQQFEIASAVSFSQPTYQIGENGVPVGAQVTVTRSSDLHLASQVAYEITGGTATNGSDYILPQSDFILFQPGESSKTITIPILQDTLIEGDETIVMRLLEVQGGNAILQGNREATITILDDDRPGGGINQPGLSPNPLIPQPPNAAPIGAPIGAPVVLPDLSPIPGMRSLRGTNRKDTLTGTNAGEMLVGLRGHDRLNGRGGNDILIGVNPGDRTPGRNEIDQLTGGAGRDLFVLGDQQRVFYNDGKRNDTGLKDYALIKDFNRRQDVIQLHGKASDYRLGSAPKGLPKGNAIFLETGRTDELIAMVQGNGKLNLNSNMFQFV